MSQKRILLVDDHATIHQDFCKVFGAKSDESEPSTMMHAQDAMHSVFVIDSAYKPQDAINSMRKAILSGLAYSVAFVTQRTNTNNDCFNMVKQMWEIDPHLQIVLCADEADIDCRQIAALFKINHNLLFLANPLDAIEVYLLVNMLFYKREMQQQLTYQTENIQITLTERIQNLEKSSSLSKSMLESTQDGIIAIGLEGEVLMYNKLFPLLWNVTEEFLKSGESKLILERLASKMKESSLFLELLLGQDNPLIKQKKEWKTTADRVMQVSMHTQYIYSKPVGTIFSFKDVTEQKKMEEQVLRLATHDGLTGLLTSSYINDKILQSINDARADSLSVAVLIFNIDNFKQVNESMGHQAGDSILKEFSKRLTRLIRKNDKVARLGGDGFVVVMLVTPGREHVTKIASHIKKELEKPYIVDNHSVTMTTSIGISLYPDHGTDAVNLLKNADSALYAAKKEGRNFCQIYQREFNERLLQQMDLESALHHAIDRNEFVIHYQPIMDIKTNKIICVEALLRWKHPTLGVLSTQQFIHLAEETGLIVTIGNWVLRQACSQVRVWLERGVPPVRLAVNISGLQFKKSDFVESIENILTETKLDSSLLELELTESTLIDAPDKIIQKMIELKNIGLHLVMDDFGTGYAGLSYLKQFPFEKVKIDKGFIQKLEVSDEDAAIVEAVINTAKNMNLQVVAKGVETYAQLHFLQQHASDHIQGYVVHKPISEKACFKLLQNAAVTKERR